MGPAGQVGEEALADRATNTRTTDKFDVFLSHSHLDAELVFGAARLVEECSLKVYVDWVVDKERSRTITTSAHAKMVRVRMRQSRSLIYLCTDHSMSSRWTPWEVGYFDGFRGTVAVLPIFNKENDTFLGSEYLGLYPLVKPENSAEWQVRNGLGTRSQGGQRIIVEGAGQAALDLRDWTSRAAS